MNFLDRFGKEPMIFDGAIGTYLQARGLQAGELPELWNLTKPELVVEMHRGYLDAGAEVLTTNTFGANRIKLAATGHSVDEVVSRAVANAKTALAASGKQAFVACDLGPTGKLLEPLGDLGFEAAVDIYREMVQAGERAGADLFLIETMSDTYEVKAAVLAVKENSELPVVVTMTFDERGKLLTGADIPTVVAMLEGLRVDGLGFNCGLGPDQMLSLLPELAANTSLPILITPNAGLPVVIDGATCFDVDAAAFGRAAHDLFAGGASAVGGCCGTTPEHIAAAVAACRDLSLHPIVAKDFTVVSSYARAVRIGERPVIIGERINPTGKSKLKQALREGNLDYILAEGLSQVEKGAHILDVNVGLPEIDEVEMMAQAVSGLQAIIDLPLQIDTADPVTLERAMRLYNGKPLVNSVNGKAESMAAVFPLVRKYGGAVVALTLDEDGIPPTAEGRIAIAERIIAEAAKYGIAKKDILVDTLTMTVSTGQDNARITLRALEHLRRQVGVNTVLGVSNVSFGLPQREVINTAFFTLALDGGLSAGIINPNSAAMMNAYFSYCALAGYDPQCAAYIDRFAEAVVTTTVADSGSARPAESASGDLQYAILKGLKEQAYAAAVAKLAAAEPLAVVRDELVPALDRVGKGFEAGTIFLPQLLMSAEAAKRAFAAVREALAASGTKSESKGMIALATVKGDIHDIGKNIVKVLLENYGYEVLDLGKDVEPQTVLEAVRQHDLRLVGLSALMTTTVSTMAATIDLLRREAPDCRVMVGGAVLTQSYAEQIGADFYGRDAMAAVKCAGQVFAAS